MNWLLKRMPYYALAVMASYAAYNMPLETHQYAFAACAIGVIYGVYGSVGGQEEPTSIVKGVVDDLLDFAPLALVNIEIFKKAGNPYALVHGLAIIPLVLDLVAKLFGDATDDISTQTLKHISNLANVVSLLYLSYVNHNYMFACVALAYLSGHLGMIVGGKCRGYLVDLSYITSYALFYFASILALTTTVKIEIEKPSEP